LRTKGATGRGANVNEREIRMAAKKIAGGLADEVRPCIPCPSHLPAEARPVWRRTIEALAEARCLGSETLALIERYASSYARWLEAERHLGADGAIVPAPKSAVPQINPWLSVSARAAAQMAAAERELGLTPRRRRPTRPLLADGSQAPRTSLERLMHDIEAGNG
jgi:P27 family predicted phage terminase small subunit